MIKRKATRFPASRIIGFFRRQPSLLRDERGVTAIEFSVLGLPFMGVMVAIMQTSVVLLSSQIMESAVQDAARDIRTGRMQQAGGTLETFRTSICSRMSGLFGDCSGLHIRVTTVTNFQSAGVVIPLDTSCQTTCNWNIDQVFSPGGGKQIVLAQVYYRYPVVIQLGMLGMSNLGDGSRLLGTATVFQNEPFT